jgi:hypothetical protein
MNSLLAARGNLSAIDLALAVMDSPQRPLDFTLLFHLRNAPGLEALRVGARSARYLYPTTGSFIDEKCWVRFTEPGDGVTTVAVSSSADVTRVIEDFLERPVDLRRQMPVQQLVILNDHRAEVKLVTRFHHAVADGLSAAMWLGHQLCVAYGTETPVTVATPFQDLPLRSHPAPVRKSRYAYRGPSHRLWTSQIKPSGIRRWLTISFSASDLRQGCRRARGFTYNDLLATCALEVFYRWNRRHCGDRRLKLGLWLPVNIRQQSAAGFGNGTGRVRLYHRYPDRDSLADKCRAIRSQLSWSNQHGEWAVPAKPPFSSLPNWATAKLLRSYLNRPWVDMTTGVFSHAERWPGERGDILANVEQIESIGQLDRRYCVAINGVTHRGQTWLTFTYDPGLLSSEDFQRFVEMYREQIALANRELGCED